VLFGGAILVNLIQVWRSPADRPNVSLLAGEMLVGVIYLLAVGDPKLHDLLWWPEGAGAYS
jgi:hypothetical protein